MGNEGMYVGRSGGLLPPTVQATRKCGLVYESPRRRST